MLSNKITLFCLCLVSISFAGALVRQRPLIGGFSPINEEDLNSDLVKEASHGAIKLWNKKAAYKNYFNIIGKSLRFILSLYIVRVF